MIRAFRLESRVIAVKTYSEAIDDSSPVILKLLKLRPQSGSYFNIGKLSFKLP